MAREIYYQAELPEKSYSTGVYKRHGTRKLFTLKADTNYIAFFTCAGGASDPTATEAWIVGYRYMEGGADPDAESAVRPHDSGQRHPQHGIYRIVPGATPQVDESWDVWVRVQ